MKTKSQFNKMHTSALWLAAFASFVSVQAQGQQAGRDAGTQRAQMLEEVVVTAQRRTENIRDVPVAVVALAADDLSASGIQTSMSLPELVPSVQLARSGPGAMFFVRGVGNTSAATGEEAANAFYVDGVYMYDKQATALRFNNIERVEVLKGPQGTLFGRNSSGGLIHVITKEPGDTVEAKVNLSYGNFDTLAQQVYLAGPLTDTLSADVAVTNTDQGEGWGENELTGDDVGRGWDWGVRSKWVWRPNDRAKISLVGDYAKESNDFTQSFRTVKGTLGITGAEQAPRDPHDTTASPGLGSKQRNKGLGLTGEFDLDWATLSSVTGYRHNDTLTRLDLDAGPLPFANIQIDSTTSAFQQEFRLASDSTDDLSWQVGVFYMDAEVDIDSQRVTGLAFGGVGVGTEIFSTMETRSLAGFGELSYQLTPSTVLTVGARYTRDKLDFEGNIASTAGVPIVAVDDSKSYSGETFRIALRQDITDNINVYASYNRGFKSGSFSPQSITTAPVDPQEVDAFEVGLKSELFDSRLRFNMAAFRYEISDYQTRAASTADAASELINAAEVEITGLELEFEAVPLPGLNVFGAVTFLDSEFSKFPLGPYSYLNPAVCTPNGPQPGNSTGQPTGGSLTCIGDTKGNATPYAPEIAGNLGATYFHQMGDGEMRFSMLYSYNDGFYFESDNRMHQPSFGIVNASVAYNPTPQWGIELWGKNITDKVYYVQRVGSALADFEVPAAPRTYGVSFVYNY